MMKTRFEKSTIGLRETFRSRAAVATYARKAVVLLLLFCALLAAADVFGIKTDLWCPLAFAGVLNMEFKFTPYVGDPDKADKVESVQGKALVFLNNVLKTEQDVDKENVSVMFKERDISPAVWIPVSYLGPGLRKGKNTIRIEFTPADAAAAYQARLSWTQVTDGVTQESEPGRLTATNQSGEGRDTKDCKGAVVMEKEFSADFAADLAWHHYPPVTSLSDEDKGKIAAALKERAQLFKPDFGGVYKLLQSRPGVKVDGIRKAKLLDDAYASGVRIAAPAASDLDYIVTGQQEVIVRRKSGDLYPLDKKSFSKIKGDNKQMEAAMTLYAVYPPQLAFVRTPAGVWEVAY